MKIKRFIALAVLIALVGLMAPTHRALADGAASTRNILIGTAAATLLIINHNKKVHERYAEDAQKQAALASERDNAQAAYQAEVRAYNHEAAVASELKREVALKDNIISQQKHQLAQMGLQMTPVSPAAAPAAPAARTAGRQMRVASTNIISYGWGTF